MNNLVYLASYKGTGKGFNGLVDKGIRFITRGQYSHSEICIGNPFFAQALCITSAGTEGGVKARRLRFKEDEWDITILNKVTPEQVTLWYQQNAGAKYDFIGVVRFMIPFVSNESKKKWFCSEAAASIIGMVEPWRYDPSTLHAVAMSSKF
jgi:hypothetical protein